MQVTETLSEGLKREFKVVISSSDIEEKTKDRLEELGRNLKVPGFRPGKVPISILKKRYGEAVRGEVLEKAVNEASEQALNERGLRVATRPKIEIDSFDAGQDLEYRLNVELLPDVTPMDFSKLELERLVIKVPENEVDEALERLAKQQSTRVPLEKPRPSQSGDVLVIDFKGSVDGETLPGMEAEDHHLELGSNSFIAGFEDQLIGLSEGDETEVKVTFPEQYANDKLAGRDAVFQVKVKQILASIPAELNDEMAKVYGAEGLDDLRQKLEADIGKHYQQVARMRLKRELLDKLAENHDFGVPEGMVDVEFEAIWQQVEQDKEQGTLDEEDKDKDEETLKAEYRAIAERRVRLGLLLSEVGRINGVEVANEDVNRALMMEAQRNPGREREVIEYFQNNPEAIANLRAPLFEDKVVDFILDLAKLDEREVTVEEFQALAEEEAAGDDAAEGDDKKKTKTKPKKKS